jgi:hypothetical protein
MNAPIEGRVIRAVDCNSSAFISKWKDLPPNIQIEAKAVLQSLFLLSLDDAPAKLHLHQLRNRQVTSRLDPSKKVNVWTLHITADDNYKASFTMESGTAYFRTCGKHDTVDKTP